MKGTNSQEEMDSLVVWYLIERPSLLEWPKWAGMTHFQPDIVSRTRLVDDNGVTCRPWKHARDEGDVLAPVSKKPRAAPLGVQNGR